MATSFVDNFYYMDPYAPPPVGTTLNPVDLTVVDSTDDGLIGSGQRDTIDGIRITASYPGDTVTVKLADGTLHTTTGVTFYLSNGTQVFSPIDGTTLPAGTFQSSTWTSTNTPVTPQQMAVTCFTPGALIDTPEGPVPVEELRVGQLVSTLDHGPQPLRWIGRRSVPARGEHAPIRFMAGALGNDRELLVSPQHRMLVSGWRAELHFGEPEVLIAAKHLVNGDTIHVAPRESVDYIHICFDRHEIVFAEGVATESFQPGDYVLSEDRALMRELLAIFPDLLSETGARRWAASRPVLKAREARVLGQIAA
ncbi:MAG: type I secretion protein [Alphaproteobacteria bacterium]|nr:MAG: type I secretion protein [Alphaproteobacteria bacterium]